MQYRKLGKTDIDVSVICLGTMTWGEQNTEAEGHAQMDYALSQGVNFFDTAELYPVPARGETSGRTESILGTWFKDRGTRDKVILGTKVAGPGPYTKHIRDAKDYSLEGIREAINKSLKRLQTDYIDLYQIHWPARPTNYFGVRGYTHREGWEDNLQMILETLQDVIKEGKVRHIGISNETPWGFHRYLSLADQKDLPRIQSIQNPYNLLNRTFEIGLAEMAIREKVGLLAYSPMAFGFLSGKYHGTEKDEKWRISKFAGMNRYNGENSYTATSMYIELARKFGLTPAQMALSFVNDQPFLTSNIIGATSLTQLKENIDSINIKLTREQLKEINAIQELHPNPAP